MPENGPFTENARQAGALELYLIGRWLLKNSAKKPIMGRERLMPRNPSAIWQVAS